MRLIRSRNVLALVFEPQVALKDLNRVSVTAERLLYGVGHTTYFADSQLSVGPCSLSFPLIFCILMFFRPISSSLLVRSYNMDEGLTNSSTRDKIIIRLVRDRPFLCRYKMGGLRVAPSALKKVIVVVLVLYLPFFPDRIQICGVGPNLQFAFKVLLSKMLVSGKTDSPHEFLDTMVVDAFGESNLGRLCAQRLITRDRSPSLHIVTCHALGVGHSNLFPALSLSNMSVLQRSFVRRFLRFREVIDSRVILEVIRHGRPIAVGLLFSLEVNLFVGSRFFGSFLLSLIFLDCVRTVSARVPLGPSLYCRGIAGDAGLLFREPSFYFVRHRGDAG